MLGARIFLYNSLMPLFSRARYRTLNTVRVSGDALLHNLNLYRQFFPGKAICPVLKANAYGHGLVEVGRIANDELRSTNGGQFLIVDSLYEAYALHKARIKSPILVLGYTFSENLRGRRLPFHFAVSDLESAKVLARQGAKLHLKVDTGMNRMGFAMEELPRVLKELKNLGAEVAGVLTHLADADHLDGGDGLSYTIQQLGKFKKAVELVKGAGFNPQWIHAGQTAGAFAQQDFLAQHGDFVNTIRLGIGLYGISPLEGTDGASSLLSDLRPAMEVVSTVVGIRHLKPGDRVSYSGTFTADRAMTLAVVPFGYYEGLPRALSNVGCMRIKGVVCPMMGRVCMNYTMVDASVVPGLALGDEVEVYSKDPAAPNSIAALAKLAGTIPYELMVRVAESVRREVVGS